MRYLMILFLCAFFALVPSFKAEAFLVVTPPDGWTQVKPAMDRTKEPVPDELDNISCLIPFTRNYMDPIYHHSRPKKEEITDTFHITLAKDEYEPVVVAFYGLKDLDKITLEVHNARATSDKDQDIQIEVRTIEYRAVLPKGSNIKNKKFTLIPSLLKIGNASALKKGRTTAFWLTAHALKQSTSGTYHYTIKIIYNDKTIRLLKLKVDVLPFALEEIPTTLFSALYTPIKPDFLERNARILLKDMRAHGMTSYSPEFVAWGEPLRLDKYGQPQIGYFIKHLQWAKEEGFWEDTLLYFGNAVRSARPGLSANYTKYNQDVDIPNLIKFVEFVESGRIKHEWPEIVYIPIDEPGSFTDRAGTKREEMAVLFFKTLHELNVRGGTAIADMVDNMHRKLPRWRNVVGWWDKMRPFCAVRIYLNGYPEGKTSLRNEIKDADARGHEVMLYENSSTMGTDPRVSRMYFGFYGWSTGVKGITSWTHPTLGGATVNHVWVGRDKRRKEARAYHNDKSWRLPQTTVCWEMVREGIDDAKYMYAFQKLPRQNTQAEKKYKKVTKEISKAVNSTKMSAKKPSCHLNGEVFSYYRKKLVQAILELDSK